MSESELQPDLSDRLSQIPKSEPFPVVGLIIFFVGVLMVAYGISALWFGMRDVMEVGGYCAEGGPYVIQQHCPDGAEVLMFTGIPAGVIGVFVALIGGSKSAKGASGLMLLAWPALFVSLGYNFIDYAINPPEGMGSTTGWWICGVLFALMGLPALLAVPMLAKAVQPERRTMVLAVFVVAAAAGVLIGVQVDAAAG